MKKILVLVLFLYLCAAGNVSAAEKHLDSDRAYNQGVDFFSKLDYNKSADSFLQSMNTQDKQLEQWSAYNLGSAFFGQAQTAEKNDPAAANQIYQKALQFFKRAIEIDPEDKDAKYNYELTAKKIIEQEQKEEPFDDAQGKQEQDKKDKPSDDDQGKQDQDKKDKLSDDDQGKQDQDKEEQPFDDAQGKQDQPKDQDTSAQQQQAGQRQQMTEQEAKMLLENFQQAEDKKKEMELRKARQQPAPGIKGW